MTSIDYKKQGLPQTCMHEISAHDIVVVCAEPGMGKTSLLAQTLTNRSHTGAKTRYEDFEGMLPEETIKRLAEIARQCARDDVKNKVCIVACDNIPPGDEADIEEQVAYIRRIASYKCAVLLAFTPETEALLDRIGEAIRFWSCDLCVPRNGNAADDWMYDEWSHGIPTLANAIQKAYEPSCDTIIHDPGYQDAYVAIVLSSFRSMMIGEEKRLRLAMILLGSGERAELDEVLERVDDDVWRLLARDAPFFGVNVATGAFSCVGGSSTDCLSAAFVALSDITAENPELTACCAKLLAQRGDYNRSAAVSLMCAHERDRTSIGLMWSSDFINVGELGVVSDAIVGARELGYVGLEGLYEAASMLVSVTGKKTVGAARNAEETVPCAGRLGQHATLASANVRLMRGELATDSCVPIHCNDAISEGLALNAEVWKLLMGCRLDEAYMLLLEDSVRLHPNTAVSTLLEMDYMLVSLLCGMIPAQTDFDAYEQAGAFLKASGLTALASAHNAIVPVARLLAGRKTEECSFEAHLQRADRQGYTFLKGLYLLALGVSDLRARVPKRSHVRFSQARSVFERIGADPLAKVTRLLLLALHYQMGERVHKPDIAACRGATTSIDHLVTVFELAISTTRRERPISSGRWGGVSCPREVHWLVNVLCSDCGALSKRIREVIPPSWRDTAVYAANEIDAFFEVTPSSELSARLETCAQEESSLDDARQDDSPCVEVTLLGGFEVRVNGAPLQGNKLERRRAKSLFALLAALPGHVAKRFVIMESIWPECNYGTAMHYVYAATSVIRTELGAAIGDASLSLVISNKTEGTVAFDEDNIKCDIDLFERRAHQALDSQEDDQRVMALCREVEDLYKGDMVIPSTDGMGVIEARSRELRGLFADAMVAGANAANRVGARMLACRFARKAHDADDLREDAMRTLVEALCAAGRHLEAERSFEEFVSHVVDITRRPPSRQLREFVFSLLKDAPHGGLPKARRGLGNKPRVKVVETRATDRAGQLKFVFDSSEKNDETPKDQKVVA